MTRRAPRKEPEAISCRLHQSEWMKVPSRHFYASHSKWGQPANAILENPASQPVMGHVALSLVGHGGGLGRLPVWLVCGPGVAQQVRIGGQGIYRYRHADAAADGGNDC